MSPDKSEFDQPLLVGSCTGVLVCDRAGEEAEPLAATAIRSLDLPLDPLRVEQRIGRLDRLGPRVGLDQDWISRLPLNQRLQAGVLES